MEEAPRTLDLVSGAQATDLVHELEREATPTHVVWFLN